MKNVIKNYYYQDYKGFVLIGADPAISTACWERDTDTSSIISDVAQTDLFYADIDDWIDSDGDGYYESYTLDGTFAGENISISNSGFESVNGGIPYDWQEGGSVNTTFSADSSIQNTGNYSVKINAPDADYRFFGSSEISIEENTSVIIQCQLGDVNYMCTGTAWFDDLKVE